MQRTPSLALLVALLSGCPVDRGGSFFDPEPVEVDDRPVTMAAETPPAISGGTLVVSRDDRTAIAADPDRDVVWRVDVRSGELLSATALEHGDEPGRVVEDQLGRIHVALRRGGAVATIDPAFPQDVRRTAVCPAPRGIAYDDANDRLHVACSGGELVSISATTGREFSRQDLGDDLRDVVVDGDRLLVSRFRSAHLLTVLRSGTLSEDEPPTFDTTDVNGNPSVFEPAVAWRTQPLPGGGAIMVHQRAQSTVPFVDEYYGDDHFGTGIQQTTVTEFSPDQGASLAQPLSTGATLPVDMSVSADGTQVAIAAAGDGSVVVVGRGVGDGYDDDWYEGWAQSVEVPGIIAVAFDSQGRLVVQSREPARIGVVDPGHTTATLYDLPAASVADTGHEMFHSDSGTGIACASCHPEGRDDGLVWTFDGVGPRRTQNLGGGIMATAPFHWDGDLDTMDAFMSEVFVGRMGGMQPSTDRVNALARWLDQLPTPIVSPPADATAVTRGSDLFHDDDVGCASCHGGAHFTNNRTVDVGTGGAFQVPSLVGVAARGPFIHDGCAPTLRDRFSGGCGGGDRHGHTSQLDAAQIDDLVAYLASL